MNSPPWNDIVSLAEIDIFIFPSQVLTFRNWALIHGNVFFYILSPLDQLQLSP
jgi:hypothetical protein